MQMQWKILQPDPEKVKAIQDHLNCHPITATVIANRNISSPHHASDFVCPTLDKLPSPMGLKGMAEAVRRITDALKTDEKILVFGDYDADGITAATLLFQFLKNAGADVMVHLPHRTEEGYGLQPKHINQLAAPNGIGLIITVDCGSSSHEAIDAAKRFGIDVIVTDHHNIESIPDATAFINPKLPDQPQDLAGLAGVGVAFYLLIGLRMSLREEQWWDRHDEPKLIEYCDLVAIGTIADMVPLNGANRILSKAGLRQINISPRPGIEALCQVCNIDPQLLSSEDITFRLAPRINAPGRISHARTAFELLNTKTPETAQSLAEMLSNLNQRRQEIEQQIFNSVIKRVESRDDLLKHNTLLLADDKWHQGVLGIVASKLTARYHRPVVLLGIQNGVGKGSGRSIPELDMFEALRRCEHLLDRYGGHRLAAGLTVKSENIRKLQLAFEEAVCNMGDFSDSAPALMIDCEIQFNHITPHLLNEIKELEPFGTDNPAPVFCAKEIYVASASMVGKYHRRMSLQQPSSSTPPIDAIQFNLAPGTPRAERFDHLAFRIQWNQYKGKKRIQIVIEDF